MVLKNRANFGPEHTAPRALVADGGTLPKNTFNTVATTTTNTLAPTAAHNWLKYDGSIASPASGGFQLVRDAGQQYTPSTYWWGILVDLVIEGTFSASDERLIGLFGSTGSLYMIFSDSDTYKLRLKVGGTDYDTTTTADLGDRFGGNTNPGIRIQRDGVRIKLWVNGSSTPEIDVADTTYPNSKLMGVRGEGAAPNWGTDEQYYIAGIGHWDSADEDDRPDYNVKHYYIIGNADVTTGQYGDEVDCANTDAVYQDLLPTGSRGEDATPRICGQGADADVLEFDTATVTLSDGGWGGSMLTIRFASIGTKTVAGDHGIDDGTNTIDIAWPNLGFDAWHGCATHFETAPDGGAWTQGDVDSLKLRFVSRNTNGANDEHRFAFFEMISVGNDPPAVGAGVAPQTMMV